MNSRSKIARQTAIVRFSSVSVLALAIAGSFGSASFAQTGAPAATGVQEVIVTASRRAENAQKAALALAVVGGDQITQSGVSKPEDLNKLVPGLKMTNGNVTSIYVRGVGENSTNANTQSAVAFSVDGFYVGRTTAVSGNFYDVQRVEVLKGPQGTLYGRNASGGAVNVLTNRPGKEFAGSITGEVGNYDLRRLQGFLNVPVNDQLALRAAFYDSKRDGYNNDGLQDEDLRAARLHALYTPNEDVSLLVTVDGSAVGGKGDGGVFVGYGREGTTVPGTLARQIRAGLPRVLPSLGDNGVDYRNNSASAVLDWNLGFATLTIAPGWRGQKFHYTTEGVTGGGTDSFGESDQFTGEARLSHQGDKLKYVVGAYLFDENVSYYYHLLSIQGAGNQHTYQDIPKFDTNSKALFGEGTYGITDQFRVTVGGRYTHEKREFEMHTNWYGANFLPGAGKSPLFQLRADPLLGGAPTGYYTYSNVASPTFNSTTGKVGFEYDVLPRSLLYGTIATGFKSGGFSISPPPNNVYQPEKLTAYTAGMKNRFFDNRLQANFEVFLWKYKNQQISHLGYDLNGAAGFVTDNAGLATIKGVNADFLWAPTQADTVTFQIEYLDAYYDTYTLFVPFPDATGCKFTPARVNNLAVQQQDCSGFRLPFTPQWAGSASYSHIFDLGDLGTVTTSANSQFATKSRLGIDARPQFAGKQYVSADLDVTYRNVDKTWSLAAYVRNVTDKVIYNSVANLSSAPAYFTANVRPPRTYGLRLNASF